MLEVATAGLAARGAGVVEAFLLGDGRLDGWRRGLVGASSQTLLEDAGRAPVVSWNNPNQISIQ